MSHQAFDTYYVIDFDRCLGDIEASFSVLSGVVDRLGIIGQHDLLSARMEAESAGRSFNVLGYIRNFSPDADFELIELGYKERAKANQDKLLLPGARAFIDYLESKQAHFCIMSYGDRDWQMLKIHAAGFSDVPIQIVDSKHKARIINDWYNQTTGLFVIPGSLFKDKTAHSVAEVVLIDDKIAAFESLSPKARGYWVSGPIKSYDHRSGSLPANVQAVKQIDEIIPKDNLGTA